MPLLPLALPHPPALPHLHCAAHPRAPTAPGLPLLNLRIEEPFINNSTMVFDTLPVRACALLTRLRAPCAPPPLRTPLLARPLAPCCMHDRADRVVPHTHTHTHTHTHRHTRAHTHIHTCPPRAPPCTQVHMPALSLLVLLARLVAPVHAAASFATKADLKAALESSVCDEDADAIAEYGAPDTWDVSAVTDMNELIGGYGTGATAGISCKATFNEVRTLHIALVGVASPWRTARQHLMTFSDCSADHGLHRSQAIGSWDVASVTTMEVRRAPPAIHIPPGRCDAFVAPRRVTRRPVAPRASVATRARRARAEHVSGRGRLQPAAQLVGRRLGHDTERYVRRVPCLQPAARLVGRPQGHQHAGETSRAARPPLHEVASATIAAPPRTACPVLRQRRRGASPLLAVRLRHYSTRGMLCRKR